MPKKRPTIRSINSGTKAVTQAKELRKSETRILSKIQHHLLVRPDDERDQVHLHPSEIAKSDWCLRQSYYRMAGFPQRKNSDKSYVLENIFDEGHYVHGKYQDRLWRMGMLRGTWECQVCHHRFEATSPYKCPECELSVLTYKEVPLYNEKHMLIGHSDGDVDEGNDDHADDPLLEIKTVGIGTLRFEAPALLGRHTHKAQTEEGVDKTFIDYDALWRDIKKPFSSHLKQGWIYCFMKGRKSIIFIYECKWNQQVKEFVVRFKPEYIAEILEECLDVKWALKKGEAPSRPGWAELECKTCTACVFRDTCYGPQPGEPDGNEESGARTDPAGSRGQSRAGEVGADAPAPAEVRGARRPAEDPVGHRRADGRRADASVRGADEVDGLRSGAARPSRGGRTIRRVSRHQG